MSILANTLTVVHAVLAICPNNSELHIYVSDNDTWQRKWILADVSVVSWAPAICSLTKGVCLQHDILISGVDWSPETNKIVTCGHDRNAFVWVFDAVADKWVPQMTVLPTEHVSKACTDVKWSPDGTRFALASSSKKALICTYEAANNWWISRPTAKHRSAVLTVAWHPSSQVIATACTDYRCRVISAAVADLDGPAPVVEPFGPLPDLGEVLFELETAKTWVTGVAWSPTGRALAYAGHDSTLHIAQWTGNEPGGHPVLSTVACDSLPFTCLRFLSPSSLVAAGHAMVPLLYAQVQQGQGQGQPVPAGSPAGAATWACAGALQKKGTGESAAAGAGSRPSTAENVRSQQSTGSFGAARAMFQSGGGASIQKTSAAGGGSDPSTGAAGGSSRSRDDLVQQPWTRHTGAITYMQVKGGCHQDLLYALYGNCRTAQGCSSDRSPSFLSLAGSVVSPTVVTTSGMDGRVVSWPINKDTVKLLAQGWDMHALGLL